MKMITTAVLLSTMLLVNLTSCTTDPGDDNNGGGNKTDTTSQNFRFETFEFGDGGSSSYFNDVWVFDENNIWAVGYISPQDTVVDGTQINNPNILRWNGTKWILEPYWGTTSGMYGVWAYDTSNIYFANGAITKYQGGNYIETDLGHLGFTGGQGVYKLWGTTQSNIWGVGPWGTVVHYDGRNWKKIDFDSQWYFYEITGNKERGTAYAVGRNSSFTSVIVELNPGAATIIYNSESSANNLTAYGISVMDKSNLILSNFDIWQLNTQTKISEVLEDLPEGYYLPLIEVQSEKDIYFWGNKYQEGEKLIHYNGKRYTVFNLPEREYVLHGGISAVKDIAVLAGYSDNKAYLIKVLRE